MHFLNERRNSVVYSISYIILDLLHKLCHQVVYVLCFMYTTCFKVVNGVIEFCATFMFERPSHSFGKFLKKL